MTRKDARPFIVLLLFPVRPPLIGFFSTLLYPINLFPITCLVSPKSVTIVALETGSVQCHYISVHCSICVDVATFPQTNHPEKKHGAIRLGSTRIRCNHNCAGLE